MRSRSESVISGASPRVSCAISMKGSIANDTARPDRDPLVHRAVCDLRAVPARDARRRAQAGIMAVADRGLAHDLRDRAGADQSIFPFAIPTRARGLDLRSP